MGQIVQLTAADGHKLEAYMAKAAAKPRGGVVVVQEIFGLNGHIRKVTDDYARLGYHAISPAIYDRVGPHLEFGYGEEEFPQARATRQQLTYEQMLLDVAAVRDVVAVSGKVGIVGYCLGGSVAWLAATRLTGFAAASAYYGGIGIAKTVTEKPACPVMMHFAERDHTTPMAQVEMIRQTVDPAIPIYIYPAEHGFNCDERSAYNQEAAALALERTLKLFREHVG